MLSENQYVKLWNCWQKAKFNDLISEELSQQACKCDKYLYPMSASLPLLLRLPTSLTEMVSLVDSGMGFEVYTSFPIAFLPTPLSSSIQCGSLCIWESSRPCNYSALWGRLTLLHMGPANKTGHFFPTQLIYFPQHHPTKLHDIPVFTKLPR